MKSTETSRHGVKSTETSSQGFVISTEASRQSVGKLTQESCDALFKKSGVPTSFFYLVLTDNITNSAPDMGSGVSKDDEVVNDADYARHVKSEATFSSGQKSKGEISQGHRGQTSHKQIAHSRSERTASVVSRVGRCMFFCPHSSLIFYDIRYIVLEGPSILKT